MSKVLKIIEALGRHDDPSAIDVLRDLGTNSSSDEVREATAKALIRRNSEDSLSILVSDKGKGINDLSMKVALSTVNNLLEIQDKKELLNVLCRTINDETLDDNVRGTARSLRALITLSE